MRLCTRSTRILRQMEVNAQLVTRWVGLGAVCENGWYGCMARLQAGCLDVQSGDIMSVGAIFGVGPGVRLHPRLRLRLDGGDQGLQHR